jgi:hypothetical protein
MDQKKEGNESGERVRERCRTRANDGDSMLDFRPMVSDEEDHFRSLFSTTFIPDEYDDIDSTFIDHIVESHNKGRDPYGYFTLEKTVYTLLIDESVAGYTVTTRKRGNSVKFGPTVLAKRWRHQGLGPQFREHVDTALRTDGIRKTYSTIPETGTSAFNYLINAGYNIEAHMRRQYTEDHHELVFGKVLNGGDPPQEIDLDREQSHQLEYTVGSAAFDGFSNFVISSAAQWHDEINEEFTQAVAAAEERGFQSAYSKKGKRVFIGHQDGEIRCTTIATLKRGGAVKLSPLFTDVVGVGLDKFLRFVEDDLRDIDAVRKYYTHIPALDTELASFVRSAGYQAEGILREPYKGGIDMIFFGKMLPSEL